MRHEGGVGICERCAFAAESWMCTKVCICTGIIYISNKKGYIKLGKIRLTMKGKK